MLASLCLCVYVAELRQSGQCLGRVKSEWRSACRKEVREALTDLTRCVQVAEVADWLIAEANWFSWVVENAEVTEYVV